MKVQKETKLVKDVDTFLKSKGYTTDELHDIGLRVFANKISDSEAEYHGMDIDDLYARAYFSIEKEKHEDNEPVCYIEKQMLELMAWDM